MLDLLLYANPVMIVCALALKLRDLREPENRFPRVVECFGLALMGLAYSIVIFNLAPGMPTAYLRPGIFLFLSGNFGQALYDFFRR